VHDLGEVGSVIVDHLAGTDTADEIVLGRAGGGDDVGSGGAGDLDGQVADPATTAVAQREATKAALAQKIQADADDGLLPADTDARALATFYAAVIQGMNPGLRRCQPRRSGSDRRDSPASLACLTRPLCQ
jgi:hypothetical protein